MSKPRKYTQEQVDLAKSLYLKYTAWEEIQKRTSLSRDCIKHYAKSYWRKERESLKSELIENALESKRGLLMSIAKHGLEIVEKGLKDLLESSRKLTPKELVSISAIVDNFDKIVKLDDGQATERIEMIKPASIIEIKKLLNDPFLELEEAEIVEPNTIKEIEHVEEVD